MKATVKISTMIWDRLLREADVLAGMGGGHLRSKAE